MGCCWGNQRPRGSGLARPSEGGLTRRATDLAKESGEKVLGLYAGLGAAALVALLFGRSDRRGNRRH